MGRDPGRGGIWVAMAAGREKREGRRNDSGKGRSGWICWTADLQRRLSPTVALKTRTESTKAGCDLRGSVLSFNGWSRMGRRGEKQTKTTDSGSPRGRLEDCVGWGSRGSVHARPKARQEKKAIAETNWSCWKVNDKKKQGCELLHVLDSRGRERGDI